MGTAASKLLYTLHWTLLDAAEECADADREAGIAPREPFPYIFPLTCIQVGFFFWGLYFSFVLFIFIFFVVVNKNKTVVSFFLSPNLMADFIRLFSAFSRNLFTCLLRYVTCWKKPIYKTSAWRMDLRYGQPFGITAIPTLSALRHPSGPKRAPQFVRRPTMQQRAALVQRRPYRCLILLRYQPQQS